ncbi:MAG: class I SAM-dependent methyltransferase [Ferruginibacter sp.]
MNVKDAYNDWAEQYDSNNNKTRDLEALSLKECLHNIDFQNCLEIGCGTGKNTEWLLTKAKDIIAIDFSDKMLERAATKIRSEQVQFIKADINDEWDFTNHQTFDLVSFSLVLEHIEDLNRIFEKLKNVVTDNGYVYVGELHPFKQYTGTKARFETVAGLQVVTCFNHNISDFTNAARKNGFKILDVNEYFDNNDKAGIPRILTLIFQKEKFKKER